MTGVTGSNEDISSDKDGEVGSDDDALINVRVSGDISRQARTLGNAVLMLNFEDRVYRSWKRVRGIRTYKQSTVSK